MFVAVIRMLPMNKVVKTGAAVCSTCYTHEDKDAAIQGAMRQMKMNGYQPEKYEVMIGELNELALPVLPIVEYKLRTI